MYNGVDFWSIQQLGSDYLVATGPYATGKNLFVIDRRDVNNFALTSSILIPNFTPFRGRLYGNLLYLAGNGNKMAIVDLSNPASPVVRSVFDTGGVTRGIAVSAGTAVTADGGGGVHFVNVADPASPALVGQQPTGGNAWDALFANGALYIANEQGIVTVTNVAAPPQIDTSAIVLSVANTTTATIAGRAHAVTGRAPLTVELTNATTHATAGNIAVAGDGSFSATMAARSGDIMTVRATDTNGRTAGPLTIGAVPFGSGTTSILIPPSQTGDSAFRARTLASEGTILAVTGWGEDQGGSDKVVVYDISNPSAPVFKRSVPGGNSVTYDMEIHNGWAYIASYDFCTLNLLDPNASTNCVGIGGGEIAVTVSGNYAFATRNGAAGNIRIYDVTSPGSPRLLREQGMYNGVDFWSIQQLGSDYLVATGPYGTGSSLFVIDRRDMNNLVLTSSIPIPNFTPFRGRLYGNLLYLAGNGNKMAIVDLSNPASPVVRSVFDTGGVTRGVDAAGTTAVTADGTGGVHFVDVTSPAAPSILGQQPTGGNAWDVLFAGGVLYVANEQGIVIVKDASVPPVVDPALVGVTLAGTASATVTGQPHAVAGRSPLTVTLRDTVTGASLTVNVGSDGSFVANLPAASGDAVTAQAARRRRRARPRRCRPSAAARLSRQTLDRTH
jgi:hypothetical protein